MARSYTGQPTLDLDFIKPQKMSFDVPAGAQDGGRNLLNRSASIAMTGGGLVTGSYQNCWVQNRDQHEYANWLAARLSGGFRFINVPIKSDWMAPLPVIDGTVTPYVTAIPNSNGTLIDTGESLIQPTVTAALTADASVNAGVISLSIAGASRPLRLSDWFSIEHPTLGHRAYRYWEVLSSPSPGPDGTYQLAISPPLREAVTSGQAVEFVRPKFVGKIAGGGSLPWEVEGFWQSRPTLQFEEAF